MVSRKELIVFGYIRENESILKKNKMIPVAIKQICLLFYNVCLKVFMFEVEDTMMQNISNTKLSVLNIKQNKMSNLIPYKPNSNLHDINQPEINNKPLCYVPNILSSTSISSECNEKKITYDGILSVHTQGTMMDIMINNNDKASKVVNIILFESNKIENDTINYHSYTSTIPLTTHKNYFDRVNQFLYCDKKHGVIYEYEGNLYQLNLKDINILSNQFTFNQIKYDNDIWNGEFYGGGHLSMNYLYKTESIFAMKCEKNHSWLSDDMNDLLIDDDNNNTIHSVKCGIFDLNKLKWKKIKSLKYSFKNNNYNRTFKTGICQNNIFDENIIYIVSNNGHTAKYDLNKNKWNMLHTEYENFRLFFYDEPIVWMDDNQYILNCAYDSFIGQLDLRQNNKKWRQMNINNIKIDQSSEIDDSLKCVTFFL